MATYCWLDVAVSESGYMHYSHPVQDLRDNLPNLALRQHVVVVGQVLLQVAVLAVFHSDVHIAWAVVPAEELDEEIRVLEQRISEEWLTATERRVHLVLRELGEGLELAHVVLRSAAGCINPLNGPALAWVVFLGVILYPAL